MTWNACKGAAAKGGATCPGEPQRRGQSQNHVVWVTAPWLFIPERTPAMGNSRQPSYPIHIKEKQSTANHQMLEETAIWKKMNDRRGKPDSRRNKK